MATLTYNALIGVAAQTSSRMVSVTADTSGALTAGTQVAVLIDNTANRLDVTKALRAALRRYDRDMGKAVKPSEVATSGTTLE